MAALDEVDCVAAIADDSGRACVDALDGAPEFIRSLCWRAWYDAANNQKLLAELADVADEDRTARFHSTVAWSTEMDPCW